MTEIEKDEIEPNKTVFMYAIREGADTDEAERIARAFAKAKSKTVWGRCKRYFRSQLPSLFAWFKAIVVIIGGAILAWLTGVMK